MRAKQERVDGRMESERAGKRDGDAVLYVFRRPDLSVRRESLVNKDGWHGCPASYSHFLLHLKDTVFLQDRTGLLSTREKAFAPHSGTMLSDLFGILQER